MPYIMEEFSQARVALNREVNKHPELCTLIAAQYNIGDPDDWGAIIGEIAAYCNIIMDGFYTQKDLENLYPQLTYKMEKMRTPIIMPNDTTPVVTTKKFEDM